jgi:sulfite reductase alpha subunit-like flavoprotein
MAADVHKALQQIVQTHAKVDAAGAEGFLEQLMKTKRYQRDVWVT